MGSAMGPADIERGLVARYAARVIEHGNLPTRALRHIIYWLDQRAQVLSLPLPQPLSQSIGNIYSVEFDAGSFERTLGKQRKAVIEMLKHAAGDTERPEPLASNIENLVNALELPWDAWKIAGLIACYSRFDQVQDFCNCATEASGSLPRMIGVLVDVPARIVEELLSPVAGP